MFKGPASILTSSPNFAKFVTGGTPNLGTDDIDLKATAKMPQRIPRMIWWNLGNLNVEREDGTAVLLGSEIAAQKWEASPAKILAASTTATILYVWW